MLQQTQVSRVMEHYYPHFLEKYPTINELADTDLDDLFSSWSGLGYYNRARNLHKTATLCKIDGLPNCMKQLQKLPGIGRYTASAICSFGYNQCVSVVDTNIARVLKRYFALKNVKENTIWEYADKFLNTYEPTKHNLALMDLGSMICKPKNPSCKECPLFTACKGSNEPELYTQTKKTKYENLDLFLGVYEKNGKIALVRSNEKLYNGLLTLPHIDPIEENFLLSFKHSYTKYKIDVKLYSVNNLIEENISWVNSDDMEKLPISSLTKKAISYLKRKV